MKQIVSSLIFLLATGAAESAEFIQLSHSQSLPSLASTGAAFKQAQTQSDLKSIKKYPNHERYQQMINGIPVYGHHVIIHLNGRRPYYSGHWLNLSQNEKEAGFLSGEKLSSKDAMKLAMKDFEINQQDLFPTSFKYHNEKSDLYYFTNHKNQLIKVYLVSFYVENEINGQPARPYCLIDANSHAIIKQWNGLTTNLIGTGPGGNQKIGRYEYGRDYPKLDVTIEGDGKTCDMENTYVKTINLNHELKGDNVYEYLCPNHSNDDEINGAYSPLNDAHFYGGVIFDMYKNWYNTTPLSFKLKMQVHYGTDYENAFWDGESMNFGDGANNLYPLVALDVAAHEVSHGLTEQNSGLEYWGQSGGLNESFSDMAGKAAEFYLHKQNKWTIGDDITKYSAPLRYMDRPEKDGNSIGDVRDFEPGMDVHYSSGVFNRLFYILATQNSWDTRKAFEVMLAANLYYWEPETNFYQATEGLLQATADLGYKQEDVLKAAQEVGISCQLSADDYHCHQSQDGE